MKLTTRHYEALELILTQGFPRTQAEIAAELGVSDRTP